MAITLEQATAVVEAALAHGATLECDPLTVAVLDPGGHLVSFARQNNSGIARPQIAVGKAWGALGMGFGTREHARRAESMPLFFTTVAVASDGRMIPVPGGVLIRDGNGTLLGAVGISGDTSVRDEDCAVHGVEAAGLAADTGAE
jgi:uncharacterized protein GlcG (DUF336 family)